METQQSNDQKRGLKPFVSGDRRINRHGRPKGFDQMRKLAQSIAHETVRDGRGKSMTVCEALLRSWAKSKEPMLQKLFAEYAFGPPPTKIETSGLESKPVLVLHYSHERERLLGNDRPD